MQKWKQERTYKQKAAGKPVTWSGEIQSWTSAVVEGDIGSGGGFPSFSPVSSVSLLSPLLYFFVIFSSSPLSLRGCQQRLEMAVSAAVRWCAVAVERKHGGSYGCSSSLVYIFFLCHSPFSPLPPPNVPPLSVIFLSGRSLLPLLFFFFFLFCSPLFSFLPPPSFCCFGSFLFTPFFLENLLFLSFGLSFLSQKKTVDLSLPISLPFSLFSSPSVTALLSFSKILPPLCPVIFPYIYRISRERVTIKVVKIAILTRHGKPHTNSDRKNGSWNRKEF